jgi:group I intron endonuclease
MKRFGSIYKITCKLDGKIYIGQTVAPVLERFARHCRKEGRCKIYIKNAIQKHGKESFIFEEIYSAFDKQELDRAEQYFIKSYKCTAPAGYNLTAGGSYGNIPSPELRKRLSKIQRELFAKPFIALNIQTGEEARYECLSDAEKDGFGMPAIIGILKKKKWQYTHKGFTFRYPNDQYPEGYMDECGTPVKTVILCDGSNILEFASLSKASEYIGVTSGTLSAAISARGKCRGYFAISYKYADNHCPRYLQDQLGALSDYAQKNWDELCK